MPRTYIVLSQEPPRAGRRGTPRQSWDDTRTWDRRGSNTTFAIPAPQAARGSTMLCHPESGRVARTMQSPEIPQMPQQAWVVPVTQTWHRTNMITLQPPPYDVDHLGIVAQGNRATTNTPQHFPLPARHLRPAIVPRSAHAPPPLLGVVGDLPFVRWPRVAVVKVLLAPARARSGRGETAAAVAEPSCSVSSRAK